MSSSCNVSVFFLPQGCNFTDKLEIFFKLRYLLSFAKSNEDKFLENTKYSQNQ
ncbi:unnamed protein product, partial [Ceratitis capitata]